MIKEVSERGAEAPSGRSPWPFTPERRAGLREPAQPQLGPVRWRPRSLPATPSVRAEYTAEAAKAGGPDDASLGMLWHKLSELPVVTIAKLRGRARGAGNELALACDMRFAARENAVMGQPEIGFGVPPGAGGVQHLGRLLGRGRAMEVILSAADFDADEAERYGWVNRALPDAELDAFVARLARRIASFPADAVRSAKQALNQLTLPGADSIRADARRFQQMVGSDTVKARTATLFALGLQTRGQLELDLGDRIGSLPAPRPRSEGTSA